MSPRRTRRGTIRESINESGTLSASKILRKTRSRVNKSRAKASEEDSDTPVDTNNLVTNDSTATASFLNDTSISTRKRRRKLDPENQNSTLATTVDESQTGGKKNTRNTKAKKQTRSNKSQVVDASFLISEDESFNKNQLEEKSQVQDLISEDETEEKVSRKIIKFDNQNLSSTGKVYKTPEKIPHKRSDTDITPKSSPLNVSFTPNRSVKTPRKSPENLGSPKTHSHDSFKLLNVPRKLSIEDSPSSSENSLQQSNVDIKSVSSKTKNLKSPKSANRKKSTTPTTTVKSRFSKSPKIVFKTPKSKSGKKSPNKALTSSAVKKSPTKSRKVSTSTNKSAKLQKTLSPTKSIELLEDSLENSAESSKQDLINQAAKLPRINLSLESKESLTSPLNSSKTKVTPSQLKSLSQVSSSYKSKKSPKFISPLSSTKTPKIVLALKSKKSPTKSSTSITPSKIKKSPVKLDKSISPSKVKKSPVKATKHVSPSKAKKSPIKTHQNVSPSKAKKLPIKTHKNVSASKAKKSPDKARKSTSPSNSKKSEIMDSLKSDKSLIKSPKKSTGNNTSLQNTKLSPRVIINKLSSPQLNNSSLLFKTKQPTINLIPVDHSPNTKISIRKSKSPTNKQTPKQAMIKSLTPASTNKMQINKSLNRVRVSLKNSTPADLLDNRLVHLIPAKTSTPREFKKRAANKVLPSNLSNNSIVFNGSSQPKSKAIKRLNNQSKNASNCQLLDDESEPSMNDSSLIHMSDVFDDDVEPSSKNSTFDLDKSNDNTLKRRSERNSNISQNSDKNDTYELKKNNSKNSKSEGNDTYELEVPKTPALKIKISKVTLDQNKADREDEQENKKNVKVHFASPTKGNEGRSSTINRISTPARAIQQKRISAVKTPTNQALLNKIERKRISSTVTPQSRPIVGSAIKRRSVSASDTLSQSRKSIRETQVASINRLSKPKVSVHSEKKIVLKTPVAKKIPNFSEIHKKNFAKMESIVDLKKRVENRHINLNTGSSAKKAVPENKATPADSTNGSYNRFGFKLRKNEAISVMSKKPTNVADKREKKRENARSALKGVRMNRRFELQMKSRTQNS